MPEKIPDPALRGIQERWKELGFDPFADSSTQESRAEYRKLWSDHDKHMEDLRNREEREHKKNCRLWNCKRCKPKVRSPIPPLDTKLLTLDAALERLERVRRKPGGRGWTALCPVHEDHSPSLFIKEDRDKPGLPFFYCSVGCHPLEIINTLKGTSTTANTI